MNDDGMTDDELEAIEERRTAIDKYVPIVLNEISGHLDDYTADYELYSESERWGEGFIRDSKELAEFIVHAPADVVALIAEVRRLRKAYETLQELCME